MSEPLKSSATPKRSANNKARVRWLPYAGAVLLITLLTFGLWPKPIPVETAEVVRGPLRTTVNEEGKTRIKQRYVVSAPVTGQLQRIPFKAGAEVNAGDVVASIEPVRPTLLDARTRTAAEARRDTAAANLEKTRATHEFASNELRRMQKLFEEKTVAFQELDGAKMREKAAGKEEAAAESALRQAEAEFAEFSGSQPSVSSSTSSNCPLQLVRAPVSGKILRVFEESSRVLAAGAHIMEIGDPSDLEVVVEVLSRDGAIIPPKAKVEFEQWGGGQPLLGEVRLVEPAAFTKISALGVEEQRVNVIADLTTPPDQRRNVGDNFRVEARIVIWEAADALKVPVGALFRRGDSWGTFVVRDGRAEIRTVKAGPSSGIETQILEGLKPGDQVILYPGSRVKNGQRVRLTNV